MLRHDRSLDKVSAQTESLEQLQSFVQKTNLYRQLNYKELKEMNLLGRTKVLDKFKSITGGKADLDNVKKIIAFNQSSPVKNGLKER